MKVLITGGAGFIGSHIADLLIEEGHRVVVVDNLSTGDIANVNPKATFYKLDILSPELDRIVKQEAPEIIIHHAALVYVQQSIQDPLADGNVNALGTLNVLNSARNNNVRKVIYASTCATYGQSPGALEEQEVSPISFYGASKYMGEIYIKLFYELYRLDYTILRYANVYGPRQKHHGEGGVIPIFVEKLKQGNSPKIFGDGTQTRDFVYVKDVARANLLAIEKGSHQTINIGTGIGTTINDLFAEISGLFKSSNQAVYLPARLGDVLHIRLNPTKAARELGWQASYSLKDGLSEIFMTKEAQ